MRRTKPVMSKVLSTVAPQAMPVPILQWMMQKAQWRPPTGRGVSPRGVAAGEAARLEAERAAAREEAAELAAVLAVELVAAARQAAVLAAGWARSARAAEARAGTVGQLLALGKALVQDPAQALVQDPAQAPVQDLEQDLEQRSHELDHELDPELDQGLGPVQDRVLLLLKPGNSRRRMKTKS